MKIVFCCTGNTCRSPMAEQLMRHKLNNLGLSNIIVDSCGAMCHVGEPMNAYAQSALKKLGVAPTGHLSKSVSKSLVESSDLIICMTRAHREYLISLLGDSDNIKDINMLIGMGDVNDPFGGSLQSYELCAAIISEMLDKLIKSLLSLDKKD